MQYICRAVKVNLCTLDFDEILKIYFFNVQFHHLSVLFSLFSLLVLCGLTGNVLRSLQCCLHFMS